MAGEKRERAREMIEGLVAEAEAPGGENSAAAARLAASKVHLANIEAMQESAGSLSLQLNDAGTGQTDTWAERVKSGRAAAQGPGRGAA